MSRLTLNASGAKHVEHHQGRPRGHRAAQGREAEADGGNEHSGEGWAESGRQRHDWGALR